MMGKISLCWPAVAALILLLPKEGVSATAAAVQLAKSFYETGNEALMTQQWRTALKALETASLLDPERKSAKIKGERVQRALLHSAQNYYQNGIKAFHALRLDEARIHWHMALHSTWLSKDPLRIKIEKALSLTEKTSSKPHSSFTLVTGDEGMQEIKNYLESGNFGQAALSLKEALMKEPENKRAADIFERLQSSHLKESEDGILSETIREKFAKAEKYYAEVKSSIDKKDFEPAYEKLKEAKKLFQGNDLKPPFYKEMELALKETEEKLTQNLGGSLDRWQKEIDAGDAALKIAGIKLREAVQKYPPSPKAQELLQKIYDRLDAAARPLLMQAKTLQELEGCTVSVALFASTKVAALFPEVPAWSEADKNLGACKRGE